jgi:hypothetical protein
VTDPVRDALFAAIDSQLELLKVQVLALRQRFEATNSQRVEIALPERCEAHPAHRCALQDDGARINLSTLTQRGKWQCRGCREIEIDGIPELAQE